PAVPAAAAPPGRPRSTADDEQGNLPASFLTSKPGPGEYIVQVVGPSGRVIRLSQNAGKTPLLSPAELRQAEHGQVLLTRTARGKPERVLAGPYGGGHGREAIAAAAPAPAPETIPRPLLRPPVWRAAPA